jgi:carbon-monoxide dehydrogenase large subunit
LWGKILRSPYPHARIVHIDPSKGWRINGVKAIVTGKDEPNHRQGKSIRDIPSLCWDKVLFVGDRVAAVAAENSEAAEEALHLIEVEYDELPAVFDPLEAMKPSAPVLHPDVASYEGAPQDLLVKDIPNVCNRISFRKGDVEKGFREADLVIEHPSVSPCTIRVT